MRESRFLSACRGEVHDTIPVWFMRQAGRYQPSYQALRKTHSMLELARSPELIAEVTVRPVEDLGVDAAILFSDIMIPLDSLGVAFDIKENVGPIVFDPIRTMDQVERLTPFDERHLDYVFEGIIRTVERLDAIPLIGFSGAPFTLASYMVEGGPSRTYRFTKELMWSHPDAFDALMAQLSAMVIGYLKAQVRAGASALQVFDSWAGALSLSDYMRFVAPHMKRIFGALSSSVVPLIYFGVGTEHLLDAMADSGATVIGVDWRSSLPDTRRRLGPHIGIQGNLDPERLLAGSGAVQAGVEEILASMAGDHRYIFNLGHGVPKETDPATLRQLVKWVHDNGRFLPASSRGGIEA